MKKLGFGLLVVAGLAGAAAAPEPLSWIHNKAYSITLLGVGYTFDSDRHLKNGGGFGAAAAYYFDTHWGAELTAIGFDADQKQGNQKSVDGQYYTLNAMYYFRDYSRFRPFLSAGVGASHFSRTENDMPNDQANIGVGGGLTYFFEPKIALRAGLNDYYNVTGKTANDLAFSAGVGFYFGGSTTAEEEEEETSAPTAPEEPQVRMTSEGVYILPNDLSKSSAVSSTAASTEAQATVNPMPTTTKKSNASIQPPAKPFVTEPQLQQDKTEVEQSLYN